MIKDDFENEPKVDFKNHLAEYSTSPKFLKMKECYENVFRKNDLFPNSKFDKNVWFLKNDPNFQIMIKPTSGSSPGQVVNSKMLNLLAELSSGGNDMKKLSVEVSRFIEKICEILYKSQIMIKRSSEQIKEYSAYENVSVLDIKMKELNKKVQENNMSRLNIKLIRLDLFPEGNYNFNFHFFKTDISTAISTKSINNKLINDKTLKISKPNPILILTNDPQNENLFEPIEFHTLDDAGDHNRSFQDFTFSGSNLSTFHIQIYRDDILFAESQLENFLELFLVNINLIKDINQSIYSFNWKITCDFNHEILKMLKVPINHIVDSYDVYLEFKFESLFKNLF